MHIDDGDTVIMMTADYAKVTVRLSDIDAPESSHGQRRPGQAFSALSTQSLRELVGGRQAKGDCYESDRYGRLVCQLTVDGVNVNAEQVRRGLAWANRANPRYVRNREVFRLEDAARAAGLGLWVQGQRPVPPWQWRRVCWESGSCVDSN